MDARRGEYIPLDDLESEEAFVLRRRLVVEDENIIVVAEKEMFRMLVGVFGS